MFIEEELPSGGNGLARSSVLMMEASGCPEPYLQNCVGPDIPEDRNIYIHRRENLKSQQQ
jgi:hypothetical protein